MVDTKQLSAEEKAVHMICRVTGEGKTPATERAKGLESYERAALAAAYDDGQNTLKAQEVIGHVATRQTLQAWEKANQQTPALPAKENKPASLATPAS